MLWWRGLRGARCRREELLKALSIWNNRVPDTQSQYVNSDIYLSMQLAYQKWH